MGKKIREGFVFLFFFKKAIVLPQMGNMSTQAVEKNLYLIY